jgi:cell wall-associated NlpC family hydrolase
MADSIDVLARLMAVLALAALAGACASTGSVPKPVPMPGGSGPGVKPLPTHAPVDDYALTTAALALRGAPYVNGGADPHGFDCSGFTQYVFAQFGVALPRSVKEQFQVGASVKAADINAGDLLFFATADRGASHVGIAIDQDEFVHAPSSRGVVRVERLSQSYWRRRFLGARRID